MVKNEENQQRALDLAVMDETKQLEGASVQGSLCSSCYFKSKKEISKASLSKR
jgi:hypothetical protein